MPEALGHPRLKNYHGFAESANAATWRFLRPSPFIGLANPLARRYHRKRGERSGWRA